MKVQLLQCPVLLEKAEPRSREAIQVFKSGSGIGIAQCLQSDHDPDPVGQKGTDP